MCVGSAGSVRKEAGGPGMMQGAASQMDVRMRHHMHARPENAVMTNPPSSPMLRRAVRKDSGKVSLPAGQAGHEIGRRDLLKNIFSKFCMLVQIQIE